MDRPPPFSVVIAWRQRPELAQALTANAAWFAGCGAEVIVVNCGGDADELSDLTRQQPVTVRHLHVPNTAFSRSLANNLGALYSSEDLLFFLDADIIIKSDVFRQGARILEGGRYYGMIRTVHESQPQPNERMKTIREVVVTQHCRFMDGKRARLMSVTGGDGRRSGAGLMLVRRQHFFAVGGFNSTFQGWGYEDIDLHLRLQFVLGLKLRAIGKVLHLTHGDDRRHIANPERNKDQDGVRNMGIALDNYYRQEYAGTYQADVAHWSEHVREVGSHVR